MNSSYLVRLIGPSHGVPLAKSEYLLQVGLGRRNTFPHHAPDPALAMKGVCGPRGHCGREEKALPEPGFGHSRYRLGILRPAAYQRYPTDPAAIGVSIS